MHHQIEKFLRDRQLAVSAKELAACFFKIPNITLQLAEQLLAPILEMNPRIQKTDDGYIFISQPQEMILHLVQVYPFKTQHFSQIQLISIFNTSTRQLKTLDFFGSLQIRMIEQVYAILQNGVVVFDGSGNQVSAFNQMLAQAVGRIPEQVASFSYLLKQARVQNLIDEQSQQSFSTPHVDSHDPHILFQDFIDRFTDFLTAHQSQLAELLSLDNRIYPDFNDKDFDQVFLQNLSTGPGVYVMRTRNKQVLYVGKAKNLYRRVNSYFLPKMELDDKHQKIWEQVYTMDIHHCGSELQALLLEQKLFGELHPQINIVRNVHSRSQLQKQRYERILVLPAAEPECAQLYILNPGNFVDVIEINCQLIPQRQLAMLIGRAFFSKNKPIKDEREELIVSWLAATTEHVVSVDIRKIATIEEAVRLTIRNIEELFTDEDTIILK